MWLAGLAQHIKYKTGWGHRWQPCHKASVRMTAPKTQFCCTDISLANRKVQVLTAAGPKDGESGVNNLTVAICWGQTNVKVSVHPHLSCWHFAEKASPCHCVKLLGIVWKVQDPLSVSLNCFVKACDTSWPVSVTLWTNALHLLLFFLQGL